MLSHGKSMRSVQQLSNPFCSSKIALLFYQTRFIEQQKRSLRSTVASVNSWDTFVGFSQETALNDAIFLQIL